MEGGEGGRGEEEEALNAHCHPLPTELQKCPSLSATAHCTNQKCPTKNVCPTQAMHPVLEGVGNRECHHQHTMHNAQAHEERWGGGGGEACLPAEIPPWLEGRKERRRSRRRRLPHLPPPFRNQSWNGHAWMGREWNNL